MFAHPPRSAPRVHGPTPSLGRLALATIVIIAVGALAYLIARAHHVLLLAFFSLLIAVVLNYPIGWLSRWMPRALATLVALAVLGFLGWGFASLVLPRFEDQASKLMSEAPRAFDRIQQWWRAAGGGKDGFGGSLRMRIADEIGRLVSHAIPIAVAIVTGTLTILAVLVLAFFLAANPRAYVTGLLRLIPRRHMKEAVIVLHAMGARLQRWTVGTLLAMTVVGVCTAVGLLLVGIDTWLALGMLSFLGEFIPFVGPIVTSIPGIAMGLAVSPEKALWAAVVYLAVQQLENQLLQPLIMRRAVRTQPAVMLVWQLVMTTVFGFSGLVVATPLLATGEVLLERLYVQRALGKPARRESR